MKIPNTSATDARMISKIADRALAMNPNLGQKISLCMDIEFAHEQCPMRLKELLESDEFNFAHDVGGICRHMDRRTGKLGGFFLPRFAATK